MIDCFDKLIIELKKCDICKERFGFDFSITILSLSYSSLTNAWKYSVSSSIFSNSSMILWLKQICTSSLNKILLIILFSFDFELEKANSKIDKSASNTIIVTVLLMNMKHQRSLVEMLAIIYHFPIFYVQRPQILLVLF